MSEPKEWSRNAPINEELSGGKPHSEGLRNEEGVHKKIINVSGHAATE
jgi:hypothetical protein